MRSQLSNVLVDDPRLSVGLAGERLRCARRDLVAPTVSVRGRRWVPGVDAAAAREGMGLLMLEGLIVRRVGADGRFGAELLGQGDLLRPWQHDGEDVALPFGTSFVVVEPSVLAVLDVRFAARLRPYPEVVSQLVGRAMARSRNLVVHMGIAHYPRIERRLHLILWHLAERWGRVTPGGVRLRLAISHAVLADLIAARRPSVTTALRVLERDGLVSRSDGEWILHGEPPREGAAR